VCDDRSHAQTAFGELILLQVKMLTFIGYLMRAYGEQLRTLNVIEQAGSDARATLKELIPNIVISLLKQCPTEASVTRKVHECRVRTDARYSHTRAIRVGVNHRVATHSVDRYDVEN
jgi:hypothetical protein